LRDKEREDESMSILKQSEQIQFRPTCLLACFSYNVTNFQLFISLCLHLFSFKLWNQTDWSLFSPNLKNPFLGHRVKVCCYWNLIINTNLIKSKLVIHFVALNLIAIYNFKSSRWLLTLINLDTYYLLESHHVKKNENGKNFQLISRADLITLSQVLHVLKWKD